MCTLCRSRKEDYLKELARDNTQLLLNKLWEVRENGMAALLDSSLFFKHTIVETCIKIWFCCLRCCVSCEQTGSMPTLF